MATQRGAIAPTTKKGGKRLTIAERIAMRRRFAHLLDNKENCSVLEALRYLPLEEQADFAGAVDDTSVNASEVAALLNEAVTEVVSPKVAKRIRTVTAPTLRRHRLRLGDGGSAKGCRCPKGEDLTDFLASYSFTADGEAR